MEATRQPHKAWTSVQAYAMASICLILGAVVGYLLNSPKQTTSSVPVAATRPPALPGAPTAGMPSADDLKRMADKQVAPLLADLQKNPKDAGLLVKIGKSYLAAQQYQSAKTYYEQAVGLKASADSLNELSFVYYSLGAVDKAIVTLDRALKMEPKNPQLLYNLGMFQWHGRSDPKAAIAAWQDFLKANPDNPKRAQVEKMIAQAKQHLNIPPGTKTDKPVM